MKNKVYFETVGNKKVFCYFSEPEINRNKIIIMSHGFRGNSTGPARTFVDFGRMLVKNDYTVLRFDQSGSGNSDGNYIVSSFNDWVDTIVYFAKKYLDSGYKVALFGQSMGATATVIAANRNGLKNKIPALILWVPDPKSDIDEKAREIYEEQGQKYDAKFWQEARHSNFFKRLDEYKGRIHLVYGEFDRFVKNKDKEKVIKKVENKNQPVMILKGQNHSPWEYDVAQKVYREEIKFLNSFF